MYEIVATNQFKKDFKLIIKRNYDISKFETLIDLLISGKKLPAKYKEHPLKGNNKEYIDCHIEPNWLLIYHLDKNQNLITLIRTGTHSDIFK